MNQLWGIAIGCSIIFSYFNENASVLNEGIFNSFENTISLVINMTGTMCFWSGMANILINTDLINKISNYTKKIIKYIFKNIKNKEIEKEIVLNLLFNLIGVGNAATASGIKVIDNLEKENKNKEYLSKNMMLFILINTASIQIIPITMISVRNALKSKNSTSIIGIVWIISTIVCFFEILIGKIFFKERIEEYE